MTMEETTSLNNTLYTSLPIDELESRLAMEELEDRLELAETCIWDCEPLRCVID